MQNQTIFELYTDDNKLKYPSDPKEILKFAKQNIKNSATSKHPQLLLLSFLPEFLTEKNI